MGTLHNLGGREYRSTDGEGGGPHDPGMEARVVTLENEVKYIRRDLDEVRADVRAIRERLGSVDSTLSSISVKLDNFPTKLQLSLWAGCGLAAVLGVAFALIALLLKATGHKEAGEAVDTLRGK